MSPRNFRTERIQFFNGSFAGFHSGRQIIDDLDSIEIARGNVVADIARNQFNIFHGSSLLSHGNGNSRTKLNP